MILQPRPNPDDSFFNVDAKWIQSTLDDSFVGQHYTVTQFLIYYDVPRIQRHLTNFPHAVARYTVHHTSMVDIETGQEIIRPRTNNKAHPLRIGEDARLSDAGDRTAFVLRSMSLSLCKYNVKALPTYAHYVRSIKYPDFDLEYTYPSACHGFPGTQERHFQTSLSYFKADLLDNVTHKKLPIDGGDVLPLSLAYRFCEQHQDAISNARENTKPNFPVYLLS